MWRKLIGASLFIAAIAIAAGASITPPALATGLFNSGIDISGFVPGSTGFGTAIVRGRLCLTDGICLPRISASSGDVYTLTPGPTTRVVGQALATGQTFTVLLPGVSVSNVGMGNVSFEAYDSGFVGSNGFCAIDGGSCYTGDAINEVAGYYDSQVIGAATLVKETRFSKIVTGYSLSFMPTKAGADGAHNMTVDVYDKTTTTVLCVTGNILCNVAAGTVTRVACSTASGAAADDIDLRVNDSACITASQGNISWSYR